METKIEKISGQGFKFLILEDDKEVARARLYVLKNDLHPESFGFIEDVYVKEGHQGKGYGTKIIKLLIEKAKECECYKLICNSRFSRSGVHNFYEKLGFKRYGYEFRMDFK
ncbi:GNAT family N-acetyltransferase [Candidatus Atribacteria bacterium MT.SAG.1]|nr:GNAT family N-acetyltransferase [Candidatus Atribacteria bacterium MT.SAG.1]